jgi:hypothetical protein
MAVAAAGMLMLMLIFVYGLRWLDYHEFLEAGVVVASAAKSARSAIRDTIVARDLAQLVAKAGSTTEIDEILERHTGLFRFAHMRLESGPGVRTADTVDNPSPQLWRFDYPIVVAEGPRSLGVDIVMQLTIWCPTSSQIRPARPERVAHILAPAFSAWYERQSRIADRGANLRLLSPAVPRRAIGTAVSAEVDTRQTRELTHLA